MLFAAIILTPLLAFFQNETKEADVKIVPEPQFVTTYEGAYSLNESASIMIQSLDPSKLETAARKIAKTLQDWNNIKPMISMGQVGGDIILRVDSLKNEHLIPPDKLDEAYRLTINENGALIEGFTNKGIFYGAMSLVQLLEKAQNNSLPYLKIVDYPDLKMRGISDDFSRGQVSTVENFKRIIEFIARYKMNVYMPYMEDVLKLKTFPTIGVDRGALSREEVKEIIAYAERHFVEVIPIFQTLGHYENILSQEEFLHLAEFPGAASLNVSSDETYEFLEAALEEVFEIFTSKYFHMGADESYDVGLGASKELVERSSLADAHLEHYKKVYEICEDHDKTVLMYGDVILNHPEILEGLPKDIIIVDWHYRPDYNYPSTDIFKEAGHQFIVSPSVWNFLTTFPTNLNAIPNIQYITKEGLENGSMGMINSNWGDYGAETIKELVLFGYAWSAQCSWNYAGSDIGKFNKNYFYDFFGIDDSRASDLYKTFSVPFNQMMWHEFWRHPLLPVRDPVWWEARMSPVGRISWMEWTMRETEQNINELENLVKKNKDHLDIIRMTIDLNNFYKNKLESQVMLKQLEDDRKSFDLKKFEVKVDQNISELMKLKETYKKIWLKYYKPDNLNMIEDKFDRLKAYFEESKTSVRNVVEKSLDENLKIPSPLIESEWIYLMNPDSTFADKAEFETEFELDGVPSRAHLQLLGDTYAKLYINDEYVDQVFARRSLSLLVDYKRIKYIDVKKYLKQGMNKIRVEVENYSRNGSAGVNITSKFKVKGRDVFIRTNDAGMPKWKARTGEGAWQDVTVQEYRFKVIAPNFETNRTSWIER